FRSTPAGTLPARDDVIATIRRGLPGTSMPGYAGLLDPAEIERLARFVLSLAPRTSKDAPAIALADAPPDSSEARQRGAALYERLGCAACHGPDGRLPSWQPPREGPGGPSPAANLREPWTFRGGHEPRDIALRILTGLDGSAMPAYARAITGREAWDIAHFVRGLARVPAWRETDPEAVARAGISRDPLERGRYLTNAMLCPLCHTPISARDGSYDTSRFLAGGMRVSAYPWGVWYSRNLTPDPDTGLGRWSEEEIVTAFTRGIARDGRRLDPMAMPWPWFARLTPEDARAVAVYLRALPAIANAVPAARHVPAPEGVGGKLLALLGAETAVEFSGGNAAADPALREEPPAPTGRRLAAWVLGASTLGGGAAGLLLALVSRRRRALGLVGGLILVAWAALAIWPPLGLMNPDTTVRWLFLGAPTLPPALDGPPRALAERGRYVATVAPCGLCHTPAGAFVGFYTGRTLAGGMEARWRVYGRAVSSNLTPHPGDGVASLPDEALLRAMRSGIGRDGRAMHWQAMPWDIGSRWSEEDQRALLAYLRALPPVAGTVPAPRGPAPDDPTADAFYFGDTARR
ncbi:MAG TPA: c-type cytochrome, partial [Methylomirabilota bacterium]|nr:c-type cytochrome [Methylomirabilota bacterium]